VIQEYSVSVKPALVPLWVALALESLVTVAYVSKVEVPLLTVVILVHIPEVDLATFQG